MSNVTKKSESLSVCCTSLISSKTSGSSDLITAKLQTTTTTNVQAKEDGSSNILTQSLALTDLIFGIYAIELWHYDDFSGKLINVNLGSHDEETGCRGGSGGLLLKRRTQETDPNSNYSSSEALDAFNKLTDPSRNDYIPVTPTDPGVGLPGVLWAECMCMNCPCPPVLWRDVGELANDPDQPNDERLQAFAKSGFKLAAGIIFNINGYRGVVIYFGNPHAQFEKLQHPANTKLINNAAHLIGAAAAIQDPIKQSKAFREEVSYQNWQRMKIKLLTIVRFGGLLRRTAKEQSDMTSKPDATTSKSLILHLRETASRMQNDAKETLNDAKDIAQSKSTRWFKKIRGGSAGIPPRFSYNQCLWTFAGVMTTHTILSRINLLIKTESGDDLSLVLAPLGAVTTLQYSLTAAPAGQPRNAFFAQILAITIAILISHIPCEPWFRSALAPAIVIPMMAKLGITHPPAGAAAIVFSSGNFGWEEFGIFLAGVAISIITAVGINNWSDKRQYPTSWYLLNKAKRALSKE